MPLSLPQIERLALPQLIVQRSASGQRVNYIANRQYFPLYKFRKHQPVHSEISTHREMLLCEHDLFIGLGSMRQRSVKPVPRAVDARTNRRELGGVGPQSAPDAVPRLGSRLSRLGHEGGTLVELAAAGGLQLTLPLRRVQPAGKGANHTVPAGLDGLAQGLAVHHHLVEPLHRRLAGGSAVLGLEPQGVHKAIVDGVELARAQQRALAEVGGVAEERVEQLLDLRVLLGPALEPLRRRAPSGYNL